MRETEIERKGEEKRSSRPHDFGSRVSSPSFSIVFNHLFFGKNKKINIDFESEKKKKRKRKSLDGQSGF